jgi:hypothetical protein
MLQIKGNNTISMQKRYNRMSWQLGTEKKGMMKSCDLTDMPSSPMPARVRTSPGRPPAVSEHTRVKNMWSIWEVENQHLSKLLVYKHNQTRIKEI